VTDVSNELAGLGALAPGASRHTEAGSVYFHLPSVTFISCGQTLKREALLCMTSNGAYPTRLMLSSPAPKPGNWFLQQALAKTWHYLSVSGIMADHAPVEVLMEHLEMYR
jgi:hypothetical protein